MRRIFVFAIMAAIAANLFAGAASAVTINYAGSTVKSSKAEVTADGIANAIITVKVVDGFVQGIEKIKVALASSRGAQDEITVVNDTTDLFGEAKFLVKSLFKGSSVYTAWVGDIAIQKTATVTFVGGLSVNLTPGDLVKIPDDGDSRTQGDSAVYYYSKTGKRFVFPNEKTYFTWYADFRGVKTIALEEMAQIPIGGNVTVKPGTRLVKFQTDPKTYAVASGGTLRWLKTEAAATKFYGETWNSIVDDIPESFYANYRFGDPIDESSYYVRDMAAYESKTIDLDKGIE